MSGYLIDTNVISELTRPRPHPGVVAWLQTRESIALSAVTLEELTLGIERAPGKARGALRDWFADLLDSQPLVIDVTAEVATAAGRLRSQREAAGRRVAQADMLVAACALTRGLILATRNSRDFEGCGIALFDPFA